MTGDQRPDAREREPGTGPTRADVPPGPGTPPPAPAADAPAESAGESRPEAAPAPGPVATDTPEQDVDAVGAPGEPAGAAVAGDGGQGPSGHGAAGAAQHGTHDDGAGPGDHDRRPDDETSSPVAPASAGDAAPVGDAAAVRDAAPVGEPAGLAEPAPVVEPTAAGGATTEVAGAGSPSPAPAGDSPTGDAPEVDAAAPHGADRAPEGPGPVRAARSGWARLGHAMRPRTTQGQLITAGLCALLGFALVVQVRQTGDTQLGALRQDDLVRLLDETTTRADQLEQESLDLQRERDELLSGSDRQQAALDAARRTAETQGILTGRLPATGPGVRIVVADPDGLVRPSTMLTVLEELRNAGAEAVEVNGQRVTASSAFTGRQGAVVLDGVTLESPFRWTVIGSPDTIGPALEIPGGALARVRADGGRATVETSDSVDVTAVRTLPEPVHATPVEGEG